MARTRGRFSTRGRPEVICRLAGCTQAGLELQLKRGVGFETFVALVIAVLAITWADLAVGLLH